MGSHTTVNQLQWQTALMLLAEMNLVRVDDNVIPRSAAISASESASIWQLALERPSLFRPSLTGRLVRPLPIHYSQEGH